MSTDEGLEITVHGSVISLVGDLDAHTAPRLDAAICAATGSGAEPIVLQMKAVSFVDSSGLRSMIRAGDQGDDERTVVIRDPSPATLRLIEITGTIECFVVEAGPALDAP